VKYAVRATPRTVILAILGWWKSKTVHGKHFLLWYEFLTGKEQLVSALRSINRPMSTTDSSLYCFGRNGWYLWWLAAAVGTVGLAGVHCERTVLEGPTPE
jgi:hypothetical protein